MNLGKTAKLIPILVLIMFLSSGARQNYIGSGDARTGNAFGKYNFNTSKCKYIMPCNVVNVDFGN